MRNLQAQVGNQQEQIENGYNSFVPQREEENTTAPRISQPAHREQNSRRLREVIFQAGPELEELQLPMITGDNNSQTGVDEL